MHFFAGTLEKRSGHFVMKADGDAPTSYITNFVFRIAVSPAFYKQCMFLLQVYWNLFVKSVAIGNVPHSIKLMLN